MGFHTPSTFIRLSIRFDFVLLHAQCYFFQRKLMFASTNTEQDEWRNSFRFFNLFNRRCYAYCEYSMGFSVCIVHVAAQRGTPPLQQLTEWWRLCSVFAFNGRKIDSIAWLIIIIYRNKFSFFAVMCMRAVCLSTSRLSLVQRRGGYTRSSTEQQKYIRKAKKASLKKTNT